MYARLGRAGVEVIPPLVRNKKDSMPNGRWGYGPARCVERGRTLTNSRKISENFGSGSSTWR